MPPNHRFVSESPNRSGDDRWTPERIRQQATEIGPNCSDFVEVVLTSRGHREQGYRACLGVLSLAKAYGATRLEAGCKRALSIGASSYSSLKSILQTGLDRSQAQQSQQVDQPADTAPSDDLFDHPAITHPNIRGAGYFH